jgi:thiol-disulfide isomerase/thioredoxin
MTITAHACVQTLAGLALLGMLLGSGGTPSPADGRRAKAGGDPKRQQAEAAAAAAVEKARAVIVPADLPAILAAVRKPGASAVLLNVWATWCDPCREEMPDLIRFYRNNKSRRVRLVLVSGDTEDEKAEAEKFLTEQGVDFVSYLKEGEDMAFIDGLDKRWSGTLPSSFLYDGSGKQVHFWSGKVTYEALQERLDALLKSETSDRTDRSDKEKRRKP